MSVCTLCFICLSLYINIILFTFIKPPKYSHFHLWQVRTLALRELRSSARITQLMPRALFALWEEDCPLPKPCAKFMRKGKEKQKINVKMEFSSWLKRILAMDTNMNFWRDICNGLDKCLMDACIACHEKLMLRA